MARAARTMSQSGGTIFKRPTARVTAFKPGASPPPLTSPIVPSVLIGGPSFLPSQGGSARMQRKSKNLDRHSTLSALASCRDTLTAVAALDAWPAGSAEAIADQGRRSSPAASKRTCHTRAARRRYEGRTTFHSWSCWKARGCARVRTQGPRAGRSPRVSSSPALRRHDAQ